jgi:hypothetical protein
MPKAIGDIHGSPPKHRLTLTVAAMRVSRGVKSLRAAAAA